MSLRSQSSFPKDGIKILVSTKKENEHVFKTAQQNPSMFY